jgi:hypothetical protein
LLPESLIRQTLPRMMGWTNYLYPAMK